jgi:hypothetical protein
VRLDNPDHFSREQYEYVVELLCNAAQIGHAMKGRYDTDYLDKLGFEVARAAQDLEDTWNGQDNVRRQSFPEFVARWVKAHLVLLRMEQ